MSNSNVAKFQGVKACLICLIRLEKPKSEKVDYLDVTALS